MFSLYMNKIQENIPKETNQIIESMSSCIKTSILTDKKGLPYVIPYTSVKYISPNDITNNCECATSYQKIGDNWYCSAPN